MDVFGFKVCLELVWQGSTKQGSNYLDTCNAADNSYLTDTLPLVKG